MPANPRIPQKSPSFPKTCAIVLSIFTSAAIADPVVDRLDSIERRLTRIESVVQLPSNPTTQPTTQPSTQPTTQPAIQPVRADTFVAVRAAILNGARWIQTTGIEMSADLDARGALIELLPGGPNWKPAVSISGDAMLLNATLKTPPSIYNAEGRRTGFFKALTATGRNMTLRNVTFASGTGFCIHMFQGKLALESVKATTFSEYFVFQESGSFVSAKWVEVKGGSRAESVWRVAGANYIIEDSLLDNSSGDKAALRGDSPGMVDGPRSAVGGTDASAPPTVDQGPPTLPGGIVRRSKFVGQVGPNPLTEDDGGQMLGIDRWRFAEGYLYQLDAKRKPECIAFARQMYANGSTAAEIVRATADKFIDPAQLAKVAKGKTKLTDNDIQLTLVARAKEVGRHSRILIENCEIVGDLRLNSRVSGTIRDTVIRATNDNTPISGNSQTTYPFPIDRVIVGGEQQPAPSVTFDGVQFIGGPSLGIDVNAWRSLKFINGSKYNGKPLAVQSSDRILNSTVLETPGVARVRTDGGLTFRNALGQEQSAWVGGYDGPGGTSARPADWKSRWREFDEKRLRAYARAIKTPYVVIDIEHWEVDPNKHGTETATQWLTRIATICKIIKQERPDVIVGCYDLLPATEYWALINWGAWQRWKSTGEKNNDLPDVWWAAKEPEYRAQFEAWQKMNDFTADILLPHVDILCPSIYPNYRLTSDPGKTLSIKGSLVMDSDLTRLKVEEAIRVAKDKPIYPFYWPVVTEDGGEEVDETRTANTISAALDAGAAGIILWSDERPKTLLERTMRTALKIRADFEQTQNERAGN